MEIIKAIYEHKEDYMSGFAIKTNKQIIKLLMDGGQNCCENYGYFMSEDDFNDFIGADLIDVKITDTELKTGLLKQRDIDPNNQYDSVQNIMFVDIVTSKGTLQFVAYNEHNGYYGHEAVVISEQMKHNEYL